MQLEEMWGIWLKEIKKQDFHLTLPKKELSDSSINLKSNKFKLLSDIDSDNFYKNPFYKILSTKDLSGYEKAISLDPIYSFPAYYEKARQKIIIIDEFF